MSDLVDITNEIVESINAISRENFEPKIVSPGTIDIYSNGEAVASLVHQKSEKWPYNWHLWSIQCKKDPYQTGLLNIICYVQETTCIEIKIEVI